MELIEPKDCITFFNSLWGNESAEFPLVKGGGKVKIDGRVIQDINTLSDSEALLNVIFDRIRANRNNIAAISKADIQEAVYMLDAIYHTRLEHHIQIANRIFDGMQKDNLLSDILSVKDPSGKVASRCVDFITRAGKSVNAGYNYAYSFATKFCSWLNPDGFIIMDGIAAGLLAYYIDRKLEANCRNELIPVRGKKLIRSRLGDYKKYTEIYKLFKELYDLAEVSYKEVDVFLWTYGRVLLNYFRKDCPFTPQSPDYCPFFDGEFV